MLVPDRRRRLLELVHGAGSARASELASRLGVSEWTVRRDLAALQAEGLLRRARGGAYVDGPAGAASPHDGLDVTEVKARIGAAAAELIDDGATVMVLAGSTTAALVPHLYGRELTVVTNGIEIAHALRHAPRVSVVVLGGYLHREQMTLLGPMTEQAMGDLHVETIVAGAYGVHLDVGITGNKIIQAGYHHGMLRHADALMVLADSSKLGRRGPALLAAVDDVTTLVTDAPDDDETVVGLRERDVDVRRC